MHRHLRLVSLCQTRKKIYRALHCISWCHIRKGPSFIATMYATDIQNYLQPYNSYHRIWKKKRMQIVALAILMLNTLKNSQSLTVDILVLSKFKYLQRPIFDIFMLNTFTNSQNITFDVFVLSTCKHIISLILAILKQFKFKNFPSLTLAVLMLST